MHDLQWRELQRANGSHRVGQGVSALGSSETTQAQISSREVTSPPRKQIHVVIIWKLHTFWNQLGKINISWTEIYGVHQF